MRHHVGLWWVGTVASARGYLGPYRCRRLPVVWSIAALYTARAGLRTRKGPLLSSAGRSGRHDRRHSQRLVWPARRRTASPPATFAGIGRTGACAATVIEVPARRSAALPFAAVGAACAGRRSGAARPPRTVAAKRRGAVHRLESRERRGPDRHPGRHHHARRHRRGLAGGGAAAAARRPHRQGAADLAAVGVPAPCRRPAHQYPDRAGAGPDPTRGLRWVPARTGDVPRPGSARAGPAAVCHRRGAGGRAALASARRARPPGADQTAIELLLIHRRSGRDARRGRRAESPPPSAVISSRSAVG